MSTTLEQQLALLSLWVYDTGTAALEENKPDLALAGWTLDPGSYVPNSFDGFSYGVFTKGTDVVIAYTGTGPGLTNVDWAANITTGLGLSSTQVTQAAMVYMQVRQKFGAQANITFTGHSLGGGLASVMAVWFDRPAITFDQAPFALTAGNIAAVSLAKLYLLTEGYSDSAFNTYLGTPIDLQFRRHRVTNYYVEGEILEPLRLIPGATVVPMSQDHPIRVNKTGVGAIQLHSQLLLSATLASDQFRAATYQSDGIVPLLLDERFYANDRKGAEQDILMNFVRSEQAAPGNGKLTHLADDLVTLGSSAMGSLATGAIMAQAMEWYYWQGTDYAGQQFFTRSGESLQYSTAIGEGLAGAENRAMPWVSSWMSSKLSGDGAFGIRYDFESWTVALPSGTVNLSASNATKSQAFVGAAQDDMFTGGDLGDLLIGDGGADDLTGGAGDDYLVGGQGDDKLRGGAGHDRLYGGAGTDTYALAAGEIDDVIVDIDGNGSITVDGVALTGGKKLRDGVWVGEGWRYALAAGGDLVITRENGPGGILVKNWNNLQGKLGITLESEEVPTPPVTGTYIGDFVKKTSINSSGTEVYVFQSDGNYTPDGAQPGAADLITGSGGNDDIQGLGGNDALLGLGGDDKILGGDGVDVLAGGLGADTLEGGDGNDVIYGSSTGSLAYPGSVNSTLPPESWPILLGEGFYWRLTATGRDDEGFLETYLTNTVGRDQQYGDSGNVIDAGAGEDLVAAGTGNDVVHGGADRDDIRGMGGNDELFGDDGDDRIEGDSHANYIEISVVNAPAESHGSDYVDGGAGNDILFGQGGADHLVGGLDNDLMFGDSRDTVETPAAIHGNDYLDGGDGLDSLAGGGRDDELFGGAGDDKLWGDVGEVSETSSAYIPPEMHGDDYLDGEDGNDMLDGEGGADLLFGGAGNDELTGDGGAKVEVHGNDYLDGEDGDDTMWGDGGDDELFGGAGADTLTGDTVAIAGDKHGKDYLDGEAGMDTLAGSGGDDTLFGGTENDVLYGDDGMTDAAFHGDDYLDGEDGADELVGGGGADRLFGGTGNDLMFGDDSVIAVTAHGGDYLDGEEGDDSLVGGGGDDVLLGGDGADLLYGDADGLTAGGADWISGGAGNDSMRGHMGNDTLSGGADADLLLGDEGDDDLAGGDGADQLQGGDGADLLAGDTGMDTLLGQAGNDVLLGGEGDDWLQGEADNDLLEGGEGNDTLLGGDGDDTLIGGAGFDYLAGGAGNDTYVFSVNDTTNDPSLAEFVNDTEGVNNILIAGTSTSTMSLTPYMGLGGNDYMLETGQGTIFIRGLTSGSIGTINVSGVTYTAGQFFGKTYAWSADQSTTTTAATLQGGKAGDSLTSSGGNSTLAGGLGNDTLTGSGGNNTYLYDAGDGNDVINDTSSASQKGTLLFGAGISPGQLKLSYSGTRLVITFGDTLAGSIEISGFDPNNAANSGGIGKYQFSDGTLLTQAQLVARGFDISGTSSNETVTGTNLVDRITGGAGDDTLVGKGGADTYTFDAGDGSDVIADGDTAAGTGDILRFGAGVTVESVRALRNGNDVIFVTGSDQLTLRNYFTGGAEAVERILFDDGTEWTQTEVNAVIAASASTDFNLVGTEGNNTLRGLGGNDTLDGRGGSDTLFGATGNDTLIGGTGYDSLFGGGGSDTYIVRPGDEGTNIDENGSADATAVDVVRFEGINRQDAVISRSGDALYVYARSGPYFEVTVAGQFASDDPANRVERFEFADGTVLTAEQVKGEVLRVTEASDYLTGFAGNDTIDGRWGADQIMGQAGNDTLQGSQGNDALYGELGDDLLLGGADQDYLSGGDGQDTMEGGLGWDTMNGGAGDDTYRFGTGQGMEIIEADASGADQVLLKPGISAANVTLYRVSAPPSSNSSFAGDSLVIQLNGGNDQLWIANYFATGTQGYVETIRFDDGTTWDYAAVNARLVAPQAGGTVNTQTGTTKANTFTVDHWNDVVTDPEPNDNDLINASVSYRVPNTAVWNMTLTGGLNLFAIGNDGSNTLRGNTGDNWFTVSGARSYPDNLYGGRGDDVFVQLPDTDDVDYDEPLTMWGGSVVELANEGNDTFITGAWSIQLPDNVENLIAGSPNGFSGSIYYRSGQTSNYTHQFVGNTANNIINTTQYESQAGSQGWAQYRNMPGFIGLLDFVLDGGLGADTMIGGMWNDTYVVDDAGDLVIETGFWSDGTDNSPNDTVKTPFETSLLTQYPYIENVTLTGNQAVRATGNASNNRLDGSQNTAANVLEGGDGNDSYVVGVGDTVIEAGSGVDTLIAGSGPAGTTFSMAGLATVENGRVGRGAGALNLEGNALANVLNGNGANNTIWGGDGDDSIDDQFLPDILYTGKNGVLETKPAADSDLLVGGNGNDTIVSRGGFDTLDGGAGDDQLNAIYATPRSFVIRFGDGYGHDVFSGEVGHSVSIDMGTVSLRDVTMQRQNGLFSVQTADGSKLDIPMSHSISSIRFAGGIVLGGGQIDAVIANPDRSIATEGADFLIGTSGADTIAALGGFDAIYGLEGADSMLGGGGNDSLFGGAGNDTLDGGLADASGNGEDLLAGGAGADVYRFGRGFGSDEANDLVINAQGEGGVDDGAFDLVQFDASVATADVRVYRQVRGTVASGLVVQVAATGDSIALQHAYETGNAGQIEAVRFNDATQWDLATLKTKIAGESGYDNSNDTLTAPVAGSYLDGRGGDDTLTGGSGNDTLEGGTGIDAMTGGTGNDTYYVDNAGDLVTEASRGGTDTVVSRASTHTLGAQVENLTLFESASAYEAVGNALNNAITGNAYANRLVGGGGVDTMAGGQGNDTYVVDSTTDVVTELAGGGTDTIETSVTLTSLASNVENVRLLGTTALNATGNGEANVMEGNAGANSLVGGLGNDTFIGGAGIDTLKGEAGDDYYIVDSADVVTELAGGGIDTVEASFSYQLGTEVERMVLTGSGNYTGTGNTLGNQVISRSTGNDTLNGGGGADWLFGGLGSDTLQDTAGNTVADGGTGNDAVQLGAGNDFVAAGEGDDSVTLGGGSDVIGLNRGDGIDTVQAPVAGAGERNDTISVGGVLLSELALSRSGNDLQVRVLGTSTELRLAGWYAATANQTVAKLQVVVDSTGDYDAAGPDVLRNSRVITLDFGQIVAGFDAAYAADPAIVNWPLTDATLAAAHVGSSNTQLVGGEVAYQYAHQADLSALPFATVQGQVASASFGSAGQDILNPVTIAEAPVQAVSFASRLMVEDDMQLAFVETAATEEAAAPASAGLTVTQEPSSLVLAGSVEMQLAPEDASSVLVAQISTVPDADAGPLGSAFSVGGQRVDASAPESADSGDVDIAALLEALGRQEAGSVESPVPAADAQAGAAAVAPVASFHPSSDAGLLVSEPVPDAAAEPAMAVRDAAVSDALIAWMRVQAEGLPAGGEQPQSMQHAWEQVDAWAMLQQALATVGSTSELGLDGALSGQQLAFGGTSGTDVTATLGSVTRMEQVTRLQLTQTL